MQDKQINRKTTSALCLSLLPPCTSRYLSRCSAACTSDQIAEPPAAACDLSSGAGGKTGYNSASAGPHDSATRNPATSATLQADNCPACTSNCRPAGHKPGLQPRLSCRGCLVLGLLPKTACACSLAGAPSSTWSGRRRFTPTTMRHASSAATYIRRRRCPASPPRCHGRGRVCVAR